MNEAESKIFMRGQRQAYLELLGTALRGLGLDAAPNNLAAAQHRIAALESELAEARVQLRMLCEDFGDNDWEDDDHLADVIDRHLGKHLHGEEVQAVDLLRRMRAEHVRLRAEGWLHGEPDPVHAETDVFLAGLDGEDEGEQDVRDASNARIAALPKEKRGEAMRRASRSYSVPETCVRFDGCRIEGGEVVWPDGERWPARPTS